MIFILFLLIEIKAETKPSLDIKVNLAHDENLSTTYYKKNQIKSIITHADSILNNLQIQNDFFLKNLNECNSKLIKTSINNAWINESLSNIGFNSTNKTQALIILQKEFNSYLDEIERNRIRIEELESKIKAMNMSLIKSKNNRESETIEANLDTEKLEVDCSALKGSGVIQIEIDNKKDLNEKPVVLSVYCENRWMVIQQRQNGFETSFNRTWHEYANGFGTLRTDFWLGLEFMHRFTRNYDTELLIELIDWSDQLYTAKYDNFLISGKEDFYQLHLSSNYEGNASKDYLDEAFFGLMSQNGAYFSTYDKLNYGTSSRNLKNCPNRSGGGWWFSNFSTCLPVNLNGIYVSGASAPSAKGIKWQAVRPYDKNYALKKSKMKIKPKYV